MSAAARWKWPLLLAMLAGAAALAFWGDKRPAGLAQPLREADAIRLPRTAAAPPHATKLAAKPAATAPALRAASGAAPSLALLLPRTQRAAPATNPFAVVADPAPPTARPVVATPPPVAPLPEGPPYAYQGKQRVAAGWEVFLVRDEQVHIVQVGSTLERRWRIDLIQPPTLTLIDLGNQQRFSIAIGESP